MKKLKAKINNYTNFKYSEFIDKSGKEIDKPEKTPFEVGDVVVIREYMGKEESIGVVLGCIDVVIEDLRTDMRGMASFDTVRLATKEDFEKDLNFVPELKDEVLGLTRTFTIEPLNEGQELNYVETLHCTSEEAKIRAIQIVDGLTPVLSLGSISVKITNNFTDNILIYDRHEKRFYKE